MHPMDDPGTISMEQRHVIESEQRVTRQELLIEKLERNGRYVEAARGRELLFLMSDNLLMARRLPLQVSS